MGRYLNRGKLYKFYSSIILKGNCCSLSWNCGTNAVNVNKGNNRVPTPNAGTQVLTGNHLIIIIKPAWTAIICQSALEVDSIHRRTACAVLENILKSLLIICPITIIIYLFSLTSLLLVTIKQRIMAWLYSTGQYRSFEPALFFFFWREGCYGSLIYNYVYVQQLLIRTSMLTVTFIVHWIKTKLNNTHYWCTCGCNPQ